MSDGWEIGVENLLQKVNSVGWVIVSVGFLFTEPLVSMCLRLLLEE